MKIALAQCNLTAGGCSMPGEKVCLRAVMTNRAHKRVWTGEYACSVCGLRFRPSPNDPAKLSLDFQKHKNEHSSAVNKQEVFNQPNFRAAQQSRKD
jgi:hypothetical protein